MGVDPYQRLRLTAALMAGASLPGFIPEIKLSKSRGVPVPAVVHAIPNTSRNDICPCGSGKKFKRCCIYKTPGEKGGA